MNYNSFLTYGLPLGSALILTAAVGLATTAESALGLATQLSADSFHHVSDFEYTLIQVNIIVKTLELVINAVLLWFGVIIKGQRVCLLAWLISQGVLLVALNLQIVWNSAILLSSNFTVPILLASFTVLGLITLRYLYPMYSAFKSMPKLETREYDLEPVGRSFGQISDFYRDNSWEFASLIIMMELVLNLISMTAYFRTAGGSNETITDAIENNYVHCARLILAIIGFHLVRKKTRPMVFGWCLVYAAVTVFSGAVFLYTLFEPQRYASVLGTLNYFVPYIGSLMFRMFVIIGCIKYSRYFEANGISE